MELSLIQTVAKGLDSEQAKTKVEDYIDTHFPKFADKYEVTFYKDNPRVLWVKMRFHYGLLSSSDVMGKQLREQYMQFINDIGPELQRQI